MKSNYKKIGDYIRLIDERNKNLEVSILLGINITKNYMPSVANQTDLDLSKYKIVRKDRFACNIMHVGRDERLPISLYSEDSPAIVSPAYITFEVLDVKKLLPEYLMMVFQKPEFDRYSWYVSDSSVRGGLEWDRFCEIEIPIPEDIEVQKNVVAVYNELLRNQKCYEDSLDDLQLVSNCVISVIKKNIAKDKIGNLVKLVDIRNTEKGIQNVLGINIQKKFIQSVANTSETDISKYKVIRKGQFAYSAMQVGRDETIRVALYSFENPAIISPAYSVFEPIDKKVILPEFLMMCFQQPESDRYGWFISDGSVRSSLEWERFCDINIPLPEIEVQKSIVVIHHVLESRKKHNEDLKNLITPLCPVLMKGVVDSLTN